MSNSNSACRTCGHARNWDSLMGSYEHHAAEVCAAHISADAIDRLVKAITRAVEEFRR